MRRPMIDKERLARTFLDLVRIDSVSREEGAVSRELRRRLGELDVVVVVDHAGGAVGGDTGNLIGRLAGNRDVPPMLLSAHMDTVEPGRGIAPVFADGVFRSRGDTILGADDKCGLAIILAALHCIKANGLPCGPLELLFTICEEIGLQGAKHLAFDQFTARMGYVLDTRNPDVIITRAPAANRIRLEIVGRAAHAGAEPEKGINAIGLAAHAIASLKLGRIDHETTCNIGMVDGGVAVNIVPERVVVHGEARSHDIAKLRSVTETMVRAFQEAVAAADTADAGIAPHLKVDVQLDFDRLCIDPNHDVVKIAQRAAANLDRKIRTATSGGGSDANILYRHGIVTAVLGTGCEKVHTVEERVALADMVRAAELLVEIICLYAGG